MPSAANESTRVALSMMLSGLFTACTWKSPLSQLVVSITLASTALIVAGAARRSIAVPGVVGNVLGKTEYSGPRLTSTRYWPGGRGRVSVPLAGT